MVGKQWALCLLVLLLGCSQQSIVNILSLDQLTASEEVTAETSLCNLVESYLPDTLHPDHRPIKYIRVNIHFMNAGDSTKNYNKDLGVAFGQKLIEAANDHLKKNRKMSLPMGNNTPAYPILHRYQICPSVGYESNDGIYFHYDDQLFAFVSRGRNRNNYSRDVIRTYGIGLDSIINLFIMPHHPDSVRSETYSVTSAGIALGSGIKLSGLYESHKPAHAFRGLVNHEIGHVLGLRHSWNTNDGCNDTPKNPNCWNTTDDAPCDTMASNNVMDYNAHQFAWSPCQIGKVVMAMNKENGRARGLLFERWCQLDTAKDISITDTITWSGARDLEGNLSVQAGGVLRIQCRLSIPPDGSITIAPGGTLILENARLHNACGQLWKGIQVLSNRDHIGTVKYFGQSALENVAGYIESGEEAQGPTRQ